MVRRSLVKIVLYNKFVEMKYRFLQALYSQVFIDCDGERSLSLRLSTYPRFYYNELKIDTSALQQALSTYFGFMIGTRGRVLNLILTRYKYVPLMHFFTLN